MTPVMTVALMVVGALAGGFGALAGIGGGIIITPVLVLYFHLPIHQAIGVSLVSVIATSTAASSVNVERHTTNIRLGMTLELATTTGAAIAAVIAGFVQKRMLAGFFICFLLYSAASMARKAWTSRAQAAPAADSEYSIKNYPAGLGASLVAGAISGLLGVGGGVIKVPVMYLFMGVPMRVATATSNFMIGVTAATSAYIYYGRGDIAIAYAAPMVAGVFGGSLLGARLASRVRAQSIVIAFVGVTLYMAAQMAWKLARGGL